MAINLSSNATGVRWVPTLTCYCDFPGNSTAQLRWSYTITVNGVVIQERASGCPVSKFNPTCNLGAGGEFDCNRTVGTYTIVVGSGSAYDEAGKITAVSPSEELPCN